MKRQRSRRRRCERHSIRPLAAVAAVAIVLSACADDNDANSDNVDNGEDDVETTLAPAGTTDTFVPAPMDDGTGVPTWVTLNAASGEQLTTVDGSLFGWIVTGPNTVYVDGVTRSEDMETELIGITAASGESWTVNLSQGRPQFVDDALLVLDDENGTISRLG